MLIKTKRVITRFEPRHYDEIRRDASEAGFIDVASYIRSKLVTSTAEYSRSSKYLYEEFRGERRSFFCPNKLWFLMLAHIDGKTTASTFMKQAVIEKMMRDAPEKTEVYKDLLRI